MLERLPGIGIMVGGAIIGVVVMVFVLQLAAVPIARGVDVSIANAKAVADVVIDYVSHGDDWWRETADPGPK
jgi:hypothetical protein